MPRSAANRSHTLTVQARRDCNEVLAAFGQRVRELRQEEGLTIEDLADLSSLHPSYVGGVERGKRNLSLFNIWRLAYGLNVTADELMNALPKQSRRAKRSRGGPADRLAATAKSG
jgi:transcriptional regulator with XRE-family HTH domain